MSHHPEVTSIHALSAELLEQARAHHAGRAARTIVSSTSQRVTIIALAEDMELAEHDSPPAATVQVLDGRVRLRTAERDLLLSSGELAPVPPERHAVQAIGEAAVLLTVALR
ncbi:hypothetical protein SAMN05216266_108182 [Amycolatopsis marina]|uniref:Cupin domain protein n=1 Tax=Amycolatopsis marina TaxID=490629 RepID=A0A1I1A698_9PSEU|nr:MULTISPECIES: hypothetical protein [Amycolatopsis]SFB32896.1 hypothetical protein SAMN05216266_108182 [Amycolatopsis marina]